MRSRFMRCRALVTFSLLFVLSTAAFADTIRLKDGSIVKGRITTFGGGKFIVSVGEGTRRKEMSFTADEVESIQFDQSLGQSTASGSVSQPVANARYIPPTQPVRKSPQVVTTDTTTKPPASTRPTATQTQPRSEPVAVKPSVSGVKPIEIAVSVLADDTSNGWTNSGFVVKKGQKITISGDGEISLGGGKTTGPSGSYEIEDTAKLLKSVPTGALIAVIGDDNNDFIYIGTSREFTASRDGALFLGVNEGNLSDNSGKFSVKVEIDPNTGG